MAFIKKSSFAKKTIPKAPAVCNRPGELERDYARDAAMAKVKKSPVTSTPPQLLTILKEVVAAEDGTTHTMTFHIWDTLARVYVLDDSPAGHRIVANFELGHDRSYKEFDRRREYLKWLAQVLPEMLMTLAEKAKKENY